MGRGRIMNLKQLIELEELVMRESAIAMVYAQEMPGGQILIKGFAGFLSSRELRIKYGEDIVAMYEKGHPHMEKKFYIEQNESRGVGIVISMSGDCEALHKGDIFDKKEFDKIVATMRECGKRLCDIAAAFRRTDNIKKIKI
jgi:hypothetical protein